MTDLIDDPLFDEEDTTPVDVPAAPAAQPDEYAWLDGLTLCPVCDVSWLAQGETVCPSCAAKSDGLRPPVLPPVFD